jgi:hypothetical protein
MNTEQRLAVDKASISILRYRHELEMALNRDPRQRASQLADYIYALMAWAELQGHQHPEFEMPEPPGWLSKMVG